MYAEQKNIKFLRPVLVGDEVTAKAEVISFNEHKPWIVNVTTRCFNQRGERVMDGLATVYLPWKRNTGD